MGTNIKSGLLAVMILLTGVFGGCTQPEETDSSHSDESKSSVNITAFTTYAGTDGNAGNYLEAASAWMQETGNSITDNSAVADETIKERVRTDFTTGSEPDILFYFTGADADGFLDKVVPVKEIRREYPEYAQNMDESKVALSSDGTWYAVPMKGYWEALYVNKKVLAAAGVELPNDSYSWDNFIDDCQKIKEAGYIPIAASLVDVPHYWWEFCIFNNNKTEKHLEIPASIEDDAGKAWVQGMQDIQDIYKQGFFPPGVNYQKDETLQELFYNGKAAFMLDGSWRANSIKLKCMDEQGVLDQEKLEDFTVVHFPAKQNGGRQTTDMITGMSSGWYITRKAWNNPEKREACVSFIEYMTDDDMCILFAGIEPTALKNQEEQSAQLALKQLDSLDKDIKKLLDSKTGGSDAVQDLVAGDARTAMFQKIPRMATGQISPEQLVQDFLDSYFFSKK